MRIGRMAVLLLVIVVSACGPESNVRSPEPEPAGANGAVPAGFDLGEVRDEALRRYFAKQVDVFGVPIVGSAAIPDSKVIHAAHVMAQYLDNDEDGEVDDPRVLRAMIEARALLVMFADFDELEESGLFGDEAVRATYEIQDLEGHETVTPNDTVAGDGGDRFDAAIEEVWHLVSFAGYARAYPDAFGPDPGSRLAEAMDLARGGQFFEIPDPYPAGAWYTYDDETCDYGCMAIEYVYWTLSTLLGAQADPDRCEWISNEWRACTPEQLQAMDPAAHALLTDPEYRVPTRLPDGSYRQ